jgi:tetratricopeptide (TPR) repeat protein
MLFDLQGKRKRVIQVIYAFLALILAVGLVGLGIGGDAQGGIFDGLLGIGNGDSSGNSEYESQIDDANAALEANPENSEALLALARFTYLAGNQEVTLDEQGITDEGLTRFEEAVDAWERYLDSLGKQEKPDDAVAGLVLQAYSNLAFTGTDPVLITRTLEGALETAEIVASSRPSPNAWLQVATFAYFVGDTKAAEEAGKQAVAEANQSDRNAVEQQLKQLEKQGKAIQAQLQAEETGKGQAADALENPLGELGGAGAAPPAPSS